MSEFILKQRDFDKVPDILATEVPSFLESEEYRRLDLEEQKVPGLVCAAFARYFARLQEAETSGNANSASHDALERCYATIEKLASSPDLQVRNLVVVEIFENLPTSDQVLRKIKDQLGSASRQLYQRWME